MHYNKQTHQRKQHVGNKESNYSNKHSKKCTHKYSEFNPRVWWKRLVVLGTLPPCSRKAPTCHVNVFCVVRIVASFSVGIPSSPMVVIWRRSFFKAQTLGLFVPRTPVIPEVGMRKMHPDFLMAALVCFLPTQQLVDLLSPESLSGSWPTLDYCNNTAIRVDTSFRFSAREQYRCHKM